MFCKKSLVLKFEHFYNSFSQILCNSSEFFKLLIIIVQFDLKIKVLCQKTVVLTMNGLGAKICVYRSLLQAMFIVTVVCVVSDLNVSYTLKCDNNAIGLLSLTQIIIMNWVVALSVVSMTN